MPRRKALKSRGGKYYRTHREAEVERKRVYRARVQSSYAAYQAVHPEVASKTAFLRILKAAGWTIPSHTRKTPAPAKVLEAERRFIEEGLGRSGRYRKPIYPEATEGEESVV